VALVCKKRISNDPKLLFTLKEQLLHGPCLAEVDCVTWLPPTDFTTAATTVDRDSVTISLEWNF